MKKILGILFLGLLFNSGLLANENSESINVKKKIGNYFKINKAIKNCTSETIVNHTWGELIFQKKLYKATDPRNSSFDLYGDCLISKLLYQKSKNENYILELTNLQIIIETYKTLITLDLISKDEAFDNLENLFKLNVYDVKKEKNNSKKFIKEFEVCNKDKVPKVFAHCLNDNFRKWGIYKKSSLYTKAVIEQIVANILFAAFDQSLTLDGLNYKKDDEIFYLINDINNYFIEYKNQKEFERLFDINLFKYQIRSPTHKRSFKQYVKEFDRKDFFTVMEVALTLYAAYQIIDGVAGSSDIIKETTEKAKPGQNTTSFTGQSSFGYRSSDWIKTITPNYKSTVVNPKWFNFHLLKMRGVF